MNGGRDDGMFAALEPHPIMNCLAFEDCSVGKKFHVQLLSTGNSIDEVLAKLGKYEVATSLLGFEYCHTEIHTATSWTCGASVLQKSSP